ncbi:hypothetical protein BKA66DRAFT_446054 [Pyrenochaeta sp. MPI-SDFR-AT-0127]|nr:hypothetical protein BKA66DRAFT_446054 [Pyrenochaeta sp. MPI-SDFR-AT-0127]
MDKKNDTHTISLQTNEANQTATNKELACPKSTYHQVLEDTIDRLTNHIQAQQTSTIEMKTDVETLTNQLHALKLKVRKHKRASARRARVKERLTLFEEFYSKEWVESFDIASVEVDLATKMDECLTEIEDEIEEVKKEMRDLKKQACASKA